MHLLVPNLHYPMPVNCDADACDACDAIVASRREATINVRISPHDLRALALVPGMQVTLVDDDGDEQLIALGRGWTTQGRGTVMRIPYSQVAHESVAN